MKNFKRYKFNMVEIVLALSVLSIAIIALMGLVPVSLRASKNSVAENSVTAVVEVIKSQIDSTYNTNDFADFIGYYVQKNDGFFPAENSSDTLLYNSNSKFPPTDAELEQYAFRITDGNTPGTYKVEFFSGVFDEGSSSDNDDGEFDVTDFDADVRVCYDKLDGTLYIPVNNAYNFTDKIYKKEGAYPEVPLTHACTFYIEVSWPSGAAYANQEHRLYKFDYFAK